MCRSIIRKINPTEPESEVIKEAAAVLKKGGVVSFPTRCLYGLGADAFNPSAIERIFEIKQRPGHKPILVVINNTGQLDLLVKHIPPSATFLMKHFWPGRATLIFEAKDTLPDCLTGRTKKIGVRLTGHAVASALVNQIESPITGTSANRSGSAGCYRIDDMQPQIVRQLDLILDAGILRGGGGSTVIDVTEEPPRILREGEVSAHEILALLK